MLATTLSAADFASLAVVCATAAIELTASTSVLSALLSILLSIFSTTELADFAASFASAAAEFA
jgi:hypothetical protein